MRSGKCSLTSEGSTTLAEAIPARASRESARNTGTDETAARPASPTTTHSSATSVSRCRPTTRASRGASAPKTAKASTGSEVRMPVWVGRHARARR